MAQNQAVIVHPELGDVNVTTRRDARRIIARWKNDGVRLTVPEGTSGDVIMRSLDSMAPRLLSRRPQVSFSDGQRIDLDGLSIAITRQNAKPGHLLISSSMGSASLAVGTAIDFSDSSATRLISRGMAAIARDVAPDLLIPRAKELSKAIGRSPSAWRISAGRRILGKCDTDGVINLSYMNVFLPQHLRDYVVYHELAHLSEMNHGRRFHDLCDKYCGGREKQLVSQLRSFKWPLLR